MATTKLPLDKIICGDNVETMRTFPSDCIDLVVTSPPYDNLRTYGGGTWNFKQVAAELWRLVKQLFKNITICFILRFVLEQIKLVVVVR